MDASLSTDQVLLAETAARLAEGLGSPPPIELPTVDDDPAAWALLTETGFACMHVAPEHGGSGARSSEIFLVVEALGAQLCTVPYLGQGVLAPELAWRAGADPALLATIADGSLRVTLGLTEDLRDVGDLLHPTIAWDARGASHALLMDPEGSVHMVELTGEPVDQADITRVLLPIDAGTPSELIAGPMPADAQRRFEAFTLSMLAADLLGIMQGAVDAATDYVISRKQFGVPVGSFQAVQHLAADAKVLLEGTRSAVWYAAWGADELDPTEALLAARHAKAYASSAALEVVELQIQMLGGIALTWEERAHVRTRRVLLDRLTFGDESTQQDAIAVSRLGDHT
jgi:alkylation response protein AidB-like acyl-CoA dehydrogenase